MMCKFLSNCLSDNWAQQKKSSKKKSKISRTNPECKTDSQNYKTEFVYSFFCNLIVNRWTHFHEKNIGRNPIVDCEWNGER